MGPTLPLNELGSQAGADGELFAGCSFHEVHREPPNSDGHTEQGTNSCPSIPSSRQAEVRPGSL